MEELGLDVPCGGGSFLLSTVGHRCQPLAQDP